MKKFLPLLSVLFVVACKTTEPPPQWWNPSGRYSNGAVSTQSTAKTTTQKTTTQKTQAAAAPAPTVAAPVKTYEDTFTPVKIEKVEVITLDAPSVLTEPASQK